MHESCHPHPDRKLIDLAGSAQEDTCDGEPQQKIVDPLWLGQGFENLSINSWVVSYLHDRIVRLPYHPSAFPFERGIVKVKLPAHWRGF
jgi:hypothetical protein